METLWNVIIVVSVALWVMGRYGKRYENEKLVWILFFYIFVAMLVVWSPIWIVRWLRSLRGKKKNPPLSKQPRSNSLAVTRICSVLGNPRGLMCCAVFYTLFSRSRVDSVVMTSAILLPFLSVWLWWCLSVWWGPPAITALLAVVTLICAISLYSPTVRALRAVRYCTPYDCYLNRYREVPPWVMESMEGAYSFTVGLAAPLSKYRRKWPTILKCKDAAKQAKLSDIVTRSNSSDPRWAGTWLRTARMTNTQDVANMAFLSIHGPPAMQEKCKERLRDAREAKKKLN